MLSGRSAVRPRYSPQALSPERGFFIMSFSVYILYSKSKDKYYIGSCSDISVRLNQHNTARNISTKFGIPWILLYTEEAYTQQEARKRESEIKKKKSRNYIEWLVSSKG